MVSGQNKDSGTFESRCEGRERLLEEAALILLWLQSSELGKEERQRGWALFEVLLRQYWE